MCFKRCTWRYGAALALTLAAFAVGVLSRTMEPFFTRTVLCFSRGGVCVVASREVDTLILGVTRTNPPPFSLIGLVGAQVCRFDAPVYGNVGSAAAWGGDPGMIGFVSVRWSWLITGLLTAAMACVLGPFLIGSGRIPRRV